MAKVSINFDLNVPEEADDYKVYSKAREMAGFIWDFEQHLRKLWKYGSDEDRKQSEFIDQLWVEWHREKGEHDLENL